MQAVADRDAAEGTDNERLAVLECSRIMKEEREAYIEKTKKKLLELPQGSKLWWTKTRELLGEDAKVCNIPALKAEDGSWVVDAKERADLLARTMHENVSSAQKKKTDSRN